MIYHVHTDLGTGNSKIFVPLGETFPTPFFTEELIYNVILVSGVQHSNLIFL